MFHPMGDLYNYKGIALRVRAGSHCDDLSGRCRRVMEDRHRARNH